jgi:DNA-binding NtrC family response regulator
MKQNILIIDDQEMHNTSLSRLLKIRGYNAYSALNSKSAFKMLEEEQIDLILLDIMLGDESGMDVLVELVKTYPRINVIMITAYGTISTAVVSMQAGAVDYIQKPISIEHLIGLIEKHCNHNEDHAELQKYFSESQGIITQNRKMLELLEKASLYASTDLPALITGESGTGKELLAEFIHDNSIRRDRQLQKINCAAFPESLLDNELFGHDRGAFTGADKQYKGIFERSHISTLFLDELGDMSLSLQAKILRAIQNKELRRIGGKQIINIDVRFIAATNKDLYTLVQQKSFREDLFYRLNTGIFTIPPLRERKDDIPLLVKSIVDNYNKEYSKQVYIQENVYSKLMDYDWPGNIRELINIISYSCATSQKENITVDSLPDFLKPIVIKDDFFLTEDDPVIEKERIALALQKYNYNKIDTAKALGMSRTTLYRKINKYNISFQKV